MPPLRFPPQDLNEMPVDRTTMVVADLPINRMVVGKIAAQAGLRIIESSPAEALAHFHSKAPSLIILDCATGITASYKALMSAMSDRRQQIGFKIIMIHGRNAGAECEGEFAPDACVSAPVTSDSLLPVIRKTAGL